MTTRIDEIPVMLERAIEITAEVDITGELGLPSELVSQYRTDWCPFGFGLPGSPAVDP